MNEEANTRLIRMANLEAAIRSATTNNAQLNGLVRRAAIRSLTEELALLSLSIAQSFG